MLKELVVPHLTVYDEPSVNLVRPGYREKYANVKLSSEIYKELEDFEGKKGKSYMLVVAVSPVEYWGDNKNKDAFTEYWLKKKHHTFTTDGTFYKNHVNKDPLKNYGENEKSWYDDKMKRVLVLVEVDNDKAPDIVQAMEDGKKVAVSMGCKIKHDVCSICGNEAPTRADYCDHMKFQPGEILSDGRKVFVYNPDPTFFDLSKVVRPAGHIEYMIKVVKPKSTQEKLGELWLPRDREDIMGEGMEKAASETSASSAPSMSSAELFEKNQDFADKYARLKKLCAMDKVLKGEAVTPEEMPEGMQKMVAKSKKIINLTSPDDIDDGTIKALSEHPLKKILSTGNLLGIRFKIPEMCKMTLLRMHKPDVEEIMHNLDNVGFDPIGLLKEMNPSKYLSDNPKVFKIIIESKATDSLPEDMDEKVAELLVPYFEKRSIYSPILEKRAFTGGALTPTPLYDASGNEYLTTQEAIDQSEDINLVEKAMKGLGLGAALAGSSYAAMKMPIIGSKYLLPASIFGTLWGAKELEDRFGDPGLSRVPSNVVMQKVSHLISKYDKEAFEKIAQSDQELLYSTLPNYQPPTMLDKTWGWMKDNPTLATFLGLMSTGIGLKGATGLSGAARKALGKISPSRFGDPLVSASRAGDMLKDAPVWQKKL